MQYRLIAQPSVYRQDERYLLCQGNLLGDSGEEQPGGVAVFLVSRLAGPRRKGEVLYSECELRYDPGLEALVFDVEPPTPAEVRPKASVPAAVPEVPAQVSRDPGLPPEDGWGDEDSIQHVQGNSNTYRAPMNQPHQPRATTPRPGIGATVRERQQAVLQAGDKIPLELLRSLRITAHSYNLVSTLVNAAGRPGPQDVRAMVITNIINWAKSESSANPAPDINALVDEAEAQLERVLKEYA